ncbi:MAG: membrane protein insertase YidC [Chloroflexi bacterium]|nr:membrane protein insertase YidC [Chloroflexota bacterium]
MWDQIIINPMTNFLLGLYSALGQNFILAIAVFTIIIRLVTLPLNLKQQRSSMQMQEIQPQIKAIQQKYRDNPQKMQEEFKKIGYNPADTLTGCLPLLIQMPVLFGLFQVLRLVLSVTPQSLFELAQRVYPWMSNLGVDLTSLLPIQSTFLWMNLGQPDPTYILPILVFATMFLQQRFLSPQAAKKDDSKNKNKKDQKDDPAASMQKSMQYTMPIMFGVFALQFQAGLSVYFVLSNIIGIGQGVYTRRIMDAEKEAQKNRPKKKTIDMSPSPDEYEPNTPDTLAARAKKSNKNTYKRDGAKKSQSKRKSRSAKR